MAGVHIMLVPRSIAKGAPYIPAVHAARNSRVATTDHARVSDKQRGKPCAVCARRWPLIRCRLSMP